MLTKTQFTVKAGDFLISRRQIVHGGCGFVPAELDGNARIGDQKGMWGTCGRDGVVRVNWRLIQAPVAALE